MSDYYQVSKREGGGGNPEPPEGAKVERIIRLDFKENLTWNGEKCYLNGIDRTLLNQEQTVRGQTPNIPENDIHLTVSEIQNGFKISVTGLQGGDELTGSWTATPPPPPLYTPG